ncbi:MAG: matrixin family metalloprotease [Myxococcota bacterium]
MFKSDAWLKARFVGDVIAYQFDHPFTGEREIVLNQDYDFCVSEPPSDPACRNGPYSLRQVVMHEMGHVIGFAHDNVVNSTMSQTYPAGGDLGNGLSLVHEDEARGMMDEHPSNSTGFNLSVSEFRQFGGTSAAVNWEDPPGSNNRIIWDLSEGDWVNGGPQAVELHHSGVGTHAALVRWYVSTDSNCSTSDYLIGTRTPSMSTNVQYAVHPSGGYDPSGVPPGDYYFCVWIDPTNSLAETREDDNKVTTWNADFGVRQ